MSGSEATATAAFGLERIGQIAMNAHDVGRATAFYRDALGMRFLFAAPGDLAFFDCGGIRLMLSRAESPELDHPGSILYFKVDDIQAAHATLAGRGVTFREEPHKVASLADHDLWLAFFRDSEGNFLALMSEVRR
ncbi:MAG TPA: VOC family protein [Thermoanaerobaculia bacterium]|nr:VOC family protein [Thermoanaerobaculia bacterium]